MQKADSTRISALCFQGLHVSQEIGDDFPVEDAERRHLFVRVSVEELVQRLPWVGPGNTLNKTHHPIPRKAAEGIVTHSAFHTATGAEASLTSDVKTITHKPG